MSKTKIVLFTSKTYSDNTHPIMIRFTQNSKPNYVKIGDSYNCATKEQWDKKTGLFVQKEDIVSNYAQKNIYLTERLLRFQKIIQQYEEKNQQYTFNMLKSQFVNQINNIYVQDFISNLIQKEFKNKQISNANIKEELLVLFNKFHSNFDNLQFPDIDYDFVDDFYRFLIAKNYKSTTIRIYLSSLRAILNQAIKNKIGCKETYPFSNQYHDEEYFSIANLDTITKKRYIPKKYLQFFLNYQFDNKIHEYHKNLFFFSFFTQGMNFKDIALLKKDSKISQLDNDGQKVDYFEYKRSKTKKTIQFGDNDRIHEIIENLLSFKQPIKDYLVPIIEEDLDGYELYKHIKSQNIKHNNYLKEMAKIMDFPEELRNITSYVARHSYANALRSNGHGIDIISQSLGHSSIKTTQIYLDSFDVKLLSNINATLL